MAAGRHIAVGVIVASLAAAAAAVPTLGTADTSDRGARRTAPPVMRLAGSFTPSAADPKLAALLGRGGFDSGSFHFTPSEARNGNRSVTVAVRTRSPSAGRDANRFAATTPTVGVAPIAYNLGVAVGWKRFAVSGDLGKVDLGPLPGSREMADVGVSYSGNRWSGRVTAATDRAAPGTVRAIDNTASYSLDVGGSYSLTRNLDLTAGMRLKSERDRLTRVEDDRRDSQAIYVGTAFRF